MTPRTTIGLLAVLVLVGLGAVGAMVAADTQAPPSPSAAAETEPSSPPADEGGIGETALQYAQCLRENGIDDYPDPLIDGGGIEIMSPLDLNTHSNAEVASAQEACISILEAAQPDHPDGSEVPDDGDSQWERIVPGGDCECADGSEFAFWEREADPTRVVLYLDGGGACVDATTCAFTGADGESDFYRWSVAGVDPDEPGQGILDLDRADNPLADYSWVYLESCTGDADLGDSTHEYSRELTVEHNGFANGTAAVNYLAEHHPDATQVVVVGNTGGSAPAPIYGGLVADLLPDAEVIVLGAGSNHWPDDPELNAEVLEGLWGASGSMPDWEVNDALTSSDWGFPRMWIQAGLHDPDLVLARFDFAYDPNATRALATLGLDGTTLENIDANEAAIEAAGVGLHSYTAPGDGHRVLEREGLYELEVGGVTLVEWIDALLAGAPLDDIHCDDCEAP